MSPPVSDSPVTQGLFDRSTGAMWAVDAFAAPVPVGESPTFAQDLPQDEWEHSRSGLGIAGNPWLQGVRPEWFADRLADVTGRAPSVVASAHGPALTGAQIERAAALYAALPGTTPPPTPDQHALDELLAVHHP